MACHTGVVSTLQTTHDAVVPTAEALLGVRVQGVSFITCEAILLGLLVV